jgi:rhomboid family protein
MIPIRDTAPSRNYPVANSCIIGINVLVYLIQLGQGADLDRFIFIYGLVPVRYSLPHVSSYFSTGQQFFSFLSFMFLHGGFWHLLGNMWSLYIFGDNVEDEMGPFRYLLFYLMCGVASGITHLLFNYHSNIPTIGASGAIAGVMGAYFVLHPKSKILTLIPIFFIPFFIEIPAFFFLGIWFFLQFLNAAGSFGASGGIAWWAHIGGFVLGIVFFKFFSLIPPNQHIRNFTRKKRSHRFQTVQPKPAAGDSNIYGTIRVTWYEALSGTRKVVSVPSGFQTRMLKVTVPAGVKEGSLLRLKGMGKATADGVKGDLLLKVLIDSR